MPSWLWVHAENGVSSPQIFHFNHWTICKLSAPPSRQKTTPTPHHSIFTGRMLFLTPNQQCQSTRVNPTHRPNQSIVILANCYSILVCYGRLVAIDRIAAAPSEYSWEFRPKQVWACPSTTANKCPSRAVIRDSTRYLGFVGAHSLHPKRHLDRSIRFCRARQCVQHTGSATQAGTHTTRYL